MVDPNLLHRVESAFKTARHGVSLPAASIENENRMASARSIDSHNHIVPDLHEQAVLQGGAGPTRGAFPDWSQQRAVQMMDANEMEIAITSVVRGFPFD